MNVPINEGPAGCNSNVVPKPPPSNGDELQDRLEGTSRAEDEEAQMRDEIDTETTIKELEARHAHLVAQNLNLRCQHKASTDENRELRRLLGDEPQENGLDSEAFPYPPNSLTPETDASLFHLETLLTSVAGHGDQNQALREQSVSSFRKT